MDRSSKEIAKQRLAESLKIKKTGDLQAAASKIETLVEEFPKFIPGWMELGRIYRQLGYRSQALLFFEEAKKLNQNHVEARLELATEQFYFKRWSESKENLEALLAIKPKRPKALIKLGQVYQKQQNLPKAMDCFKKVLETEPNHLNANIYLAIALREAGLFAEAEQQLQTALQHHPNEYKILMELGELQEKWQQLEKAISYYQQAADAEPSLLEPNLKIAESFKEMGQTEKAIAILQNARNLFQDDIRVLISLGKLSRKQEDRHKAMEYFQLALSRAPTHLWANFYMAQELQFAGLFHEAEEQLQTALEYHPQDVKILFQLGELEQKRHGLEKAIAYFQQAKDSGLDSLKPSLKIVETLRKFHQLDRAEIELQQLLEQYPDEYQVIIQFAHLERQRGKRESALNWFRQALATVSDPTQEKDARLCAIEELRELGRLDDARQEVESVLEQYPEDIRGRMLLGSIFQEIPDLAAAADLYKSILAIEPKHLYARLQLGKTLSRSGGVTRAIQLLEETYQLLGPNLQLLTQLGQLAMALEDWHTARKWYELAYDKYPFDPQIPAALANLMFLQGEIDEGFALLEESQNRLPHAVAIPLKIAELNLRLGNLELSEQWLKQARNRFPHHFPLLFLLSRVYMQAGDYGAVLELLEEIKSDRTTYIQQTEQLRGEIAIHQYDYEKAEGHFRASIASSPTTHNRNRLAVTLLLKGKINEAFTQLQLATEELGLKTPPGKVPVPLISNLAQRINAFKIVPPLLAKLMAAEEEIGEDRLIVLASIIAEEPSYLGAAIYLARELRHQLIFDKVRQALPGSQSQLPSIPKRIVQYWDEPEPPKEVEKLSQTWRNLNPEYEYIRFSFDGAMAFLKEHYYLDPRVLEAFKICEEPASQADFFRLAYLNKMGGFYADADDLARQPLNPMIALNPELVLLQEDGACMGNNFLGCIPGQMVIRTAFAQAVTNLINYSADGPWLQTGPGLITCKLSSSLLPYLTYTDYHMWPRLLILSQWELRYFITEHIQLPYKRTAKSWSHNAYKRRIGN